MSKYHSVITSSIHQDIGNHKSKRSGPCREQFNSQLTATFFFFSTFTEGLFILSHLGKHMFLLFELLK